MTRFKLLGASRVLTVIGRMLGPKDAVPDCADLVKRHRATALLLSERGGGVGSGAWT